MTNVTLHFSLRPYRFSSIGLFVLFLNFAASVNAFADKITDGTLILNIDQTSLANNIDINNIPGIPSIYLEHYFSPVEAAGLTSNQILQNDTPVNLLDWNANQISSQNLQFTVNGSNLGVPPQGRHPQANNFAFSPTNFDNTAAGEIGLGGVLRFRVDVNPPTNRIVTGDFALEYNQANIDTNSGQSGWSLINFFSFKSDVFDFYNVSAVITDKKLELSGQLGLADGFAHLNGNLGALVGDFNFQANVLTNATPVPEPTYASLLATGLIGLLSARKKHKTY